MAIRYKDGNLPQLNLGGNKGLFVLITKRSVLSGTAISRDSNHIIWTLLLFLSLVSHFFLCVGFILSELTKIVANADNLIYHFS